MDTYGAAILSNHGTYNDMQLPNHKFMNMKHDAK